MLVNTRSSLRIAGPTRYHSAVARSTGAAPVPIPEFQRSSQSGIFAALAAPGYPRLWASGWLWNLSRWMAAFLGSYLVNQLTGSPLLVQLTGAAFYLPILLGGAVGG